MNDAIQNMITISEKPLNTETPQSALRDQITPNHSFYVRNHFEVPSIDDSTWKLKVEGTVNNAIEFTLESIQALPQRDMVVLLECAGNGRTTLDPPVKGILWDLGAVAQAKFTGTPLKSLLDLLETPANTVEVLFTGADSGEVETGESTPYARSLPIDIAVHPDVMLVWAMNDEPLPSNHGYPLRLLVPGWYGMASVKWLQQISFLNAPFEGFFQEREYVYLDSDDSPEGAPVQETRVRSMILSHINEDTVAVGIQQISGIAWSGQGEISEVLNSIDGGADWHPAELIKSNDRYGWTQWHARLEFPQPGTYTLITRATDSAGNVQPLSQIWNRGGYGNNMVQQIKLHAG